MAMTQSTIVVGVFQNIDQARRAIDDLRRNGFTEDEVGFLTRATTTAQQGDENARPPLRPYGDTLPPDLGDTGGSGAVV